MEQRKDRTDKESQEEVERQKTISNKTQDKKCKIENKIVTHDEEIMNVIQVLERERQEDYKQDIQKLVLQQLRKEMEGRKRHEM